MEWDGIKIIPNEAITREKNAIYGDVPYLARIEREIKPDLYFFHNDSYRYGYLIPLYAPDLFMKSVFWLPFEGTNPDLLGLQLFPKFSAVRFVTKSALALHEAQLQGIDRGQIYHAIDLDNLTPCLDKQQAKIKHIGARLSARGNKSDPTKTFVVVRVDRHQPRKYWDRTLLSFAKFAEGKQDVFLLAKCDPRDITMPNMDLEGMAKDLNIANKVAFDNFFFNAKSLCESFYWPADCFMTTTSAEGFGLAVAESMACGIPVICPDTPVLPEITGGHAALCPIKDHLFYEPLKVTHNLVDIDYTASMLERTYQDWRDGGKNNHAVAQQAKWLARDRYSPKSVYDQWDQVFKKIKGV
jgi:glycosyltransferase involved in cell wall biosynthesis